MLRNKQSQKYVIGCSYMNDEFNGRNKYTCIEESTANYIRGRKPKDFFTTRNAQFSSKSAAGPLPCFNQANISNAFALFTPA